MTKETTKESRKEHWNSTRDYDKRKEIIELTKRDVTQKAACAYVGLAVSTFHDRLSRDVKLSEEYDRSKQYMDVITSNAITHAITDKEIPSTDRAKLSFEWKKRRDKRYTDKQDVQQTVTETNPLSDKLKELDG